MSWKFTSWSKISQENIHRRCSLCRAGWGSDAEEHLDAGMCGCVQLCIRTEEVNKKPIQTIDKKGSNFRVLST